MTSKQDDVHFVLFPKWGNKIEVVALFLNSVRVSNPQHLNYTQVLVEDPP